MTSNAGLWNLNRKWSLSIFCFNFLFLIFFFFFSKKQRNNITAKDCYQNNKEVLREKAKNKKNYLKKIRI